ncbi:MAG: phosphotransferase, partial [Mycobacteriaceae bacterium]
AFFVKHVQSFARSPLFAQVPTEIAALAEAGVPWRTEPLAYRSDLGDRLPRGLRMPRAIGVFDLDEKSASLWLEVIVTVSTAWDTARYARAAHLLGRLAASPQVRERANVGQLGWTVRDYLDGRLTHQVLPLVRDASIWQHPLTARAFDDSLRERLQACADRAVELVDELADLPLGTVHGDACPNNLLVTADDANGFVLIDYGYLSEGPIGFDLGQLLVGDVQIGRRPASTLRIVEDTILPSYVEGLRAEGCDVELDVVRRAHALHLMVFTGLSTVPFEHLGTELTPALHEMAAERATIARFSLDLLDATETPSAA